MKREAALGRCARSCIEAEDTDQRGPVDDATRQQWARRVVDAILDRKRCALVAAQNGV